MTYLQALSMRINILWSDIPANETCRQILFLQHTNIINTISRCDKFVQYGYSKHRDSYTVFHRTTVWEDRKHPYSPSEILDMPSWWPHDLVDGDIPLTHWSRVTHICVGNLTIIGSDNGLSPGRRQAITWTNAGLLLIGPLGTNFNEILFGIQTFSFKKMHSEMSSGKWRPSCLGLNVLTLSASIRVFIVLKTVWALPVRESVTLQRLLSLTEPIATIHGTTFGRSSYYRIYQNHGICIQHLISTEYYNIHTQFA